ncbi:MAG TPA: DUF4440 domain-containing protein [Burkholderiales bacterium]|jgi:uncharacterized protein (TIGR02246 family)
MPVTIPNDMSRAFVEALNAGSVEALLELYEPNVKYVIRSGKIIEGRAAVRETLERLVAAKGTIQIDNTYCLISDNIALVRAQWSFTGIGQDRKPIESRGNSAEVLQRGADGRWRYLIDHPFGAG